MNTSSFLFTSESVTEGHPDKMCDQISDAILDAHLSQDPKSRVAAEVMSGTGFVHLAGEITSNARIDFAQVTRDVVREIGYTDSAIGFDADTCAILNSVGRQSPDISQGVTEGEGLHKEQGAGDQGLMFGYATNETKEFMPMPIFYAHLLTKRLTDARKCKEIKWLRPDGKGQVTVEYHQGKPKRIHTVLISTQHSPEVTHEEISKTIRKDVIEKVIPANLLDSNTRYFVNPTGRFVVGGPMGDCGLTGRKIIVDTYGGWGRHGGGAFSGKDPTKVDRSACYMSRYIAKNIVAAGIADACEVQVAYAIGMAEPISLMVQTFGTGKIAEEKLTSAVREVFPLTPKGIIDALDLQKPRYRATAAYGHFGRTESSFTWEKTDKVEALKALLKF